MMNALELMLTRYVTNKVSSLNMGPGGEGWGPAFPLGGTTRSPRNLCYNEDLC